MCEFENIWFELLGSKKRQKIIVGILCRHPQSCKDEFSQLCSEMKKEAKYNCEYYCMYYVILTKIYSMYMYQMMVEYISM